MHDSHHAWVGTSLEAIPEPFRTGGTDVLHVVRDRFSIDDARELSAQALQKPFALPKRTFVLVVNDIAIEAQNALLKLFEEPPKDAQFFVIKPDTLELLPTLSSRLMKLAPQEAVSREDHFALFAKAPYKDRLALIAVKTKDKERDWIESIVAGCERFASEHRNVELMKEVLLVRTYIKTKGASVKMLLESLALRLPVA